MTTLYHTTTSAPAALPIYHRDSAGKLHSALYEKTDAALEALGLYLTPDKPTYDPATQRVQWDQAAQDWAIEDLSPPPAPQPVQLTKLQFITLGQTDGGMTDAQLVAARSDENLAAMWIKLEMATSVDRDNADTQAAIGALDLLGYLPNGAAAVLAAWPTA